MLTGGAPFGTDPHASAGTPPTPPAELMAGGGHEPVWQRNSALTLLAGVGVLLLAMGVGVLIGRAGGGKQAAGTPQILTVAGGSPTTNPTGAGSTEAAFTGDWPAGTKGYTVELQTLATSSTVSGVEAAKSAASAKGAKAVGALKSDEYTSLTAGSYVIYAGVYHTRAQAEKALSALKKRFPSAKVIEVSKRSSGGSGAASSSEPEVKQPGGVGESIDKPAPPSVLEGLKKARGKNYEEKSKNLPNVVGT